MRQILKRIVETLVVIFGNCIYAFGIAMFILPSGLITGGTTGIALFVNDVFHTPVTVFVFVFNTIMFLIGFFAFGWKFAANTIVSTFSYPIALELMQDLQKKLGMAVILVTHDLGVIADMCDNIIVMYGGRICERGTAREIFYNPKHEYTKGLLRSIPNVNNMKKKLVPIAGTPINMLNLPAGCAFCTRCDAAMKICLTEHPDELTINENHKAACWVNIRDRLMAEGGEGNV